MKSVQTEKLTYDQIYGKLDGLAALVVASNEPLKHKKDERDTAFVKRIVASYMTVVQK